MKKIKQTKKPNRYGRKRPDRPEKRANEIVEAIRLINMPKRKRLESVKRHREWQKLLDKDPFFTEVFGK